MIFHIFIDGEKIEKETDRENLPPLSKKDTLENDFPYIYLWSKKNSTKGGEEDKIGGQPPLITLPVDLITKEGRGVIGMPTDVPPTNDTLVSFASLCLPSRTILHIHRWINMWLPVSFVPCSNRGRGGSGIG